VIPQIWFEKKMIPNLIVPNRLVALRSKFWSHFSGRMFVNIKDHIFGIRFLGSYFWYQIFGIIFLWHIFWITFLWSSFASLNSNFFQKFNLFFPDRNKKNMFVEKSNFCLSKGNFSILSKSKQKSENKNYCNFENIIFIIITCSFKLFNHGNWKINKQKLATKTIILAPKK